jgi:hypothetical protein
MFWILFLMGKNLIKLEIEIKKARGRNLSKLDIQIE